MNLEAKKLSVVQMILNINSEIILDEINAKIIQIIPDINGNEEDVLLAKYVGRIEEGIVLEKIMKDQNYQGIDNEKMNRLAKEANIEEPIEQLLEMID